MIVHEATEALRAHASEKTRAMYLRHGAGNNTLGVSMADIESLRKKIKKDHGLATALWDTGVTEAMYLASLIGDPNAFTEGELDRWVSTESSRMVLDAFASHMAAKSPFALSRMKSWIDSPVESVAQSGWLLLAVITRQGAPDDEMLERYIHRIENGIHSAANRTRYAMNGALIAIGVSRERLRDTVLDAAKRVGKVEVDHGDTACQTPDAVTYIRKAVERQRTKLA